MQESANLPEVGSVWLFLGRKGKESSQLVCSRSGEGLVQSWVIGGVCAFLLLQETRDETQLGPVPFCL